MSIVVAIAVILGQVVVALVNFFIRTTKTAHEVRLALTCFCIDDFLLINSRSARRKKKWVTDY